MGIWEIICFSGYVLSGGDSGWIGYYFGGYAVAIVLAALVILFTIL